jgi:mannitol/fructose-specific phosphotransferase system IIA component (Ntr-type)
LEEKISTAQGKLRIQSKHRTIETLLEYGLLLFRLIDKGYFDAQEVENPILLLLLKKLTPEDTQLILRLLVEEIGEEEFSRIVELCKDSSSQLR